MVKTLEEALTPEQLIFGLTVDNIPTVNLRGQYGHDRQTVLDEGLTDEALHAWRFGEGNLTFTYADPESYFTTLLRTTIVGIECTIESSALDELLFSNRLTEELRHQVRNPLSLARSVPEAYYNRVPQLVNANAPLKSYNGMLWHTVRRFYTEVRNPLFHGFQLRDVKADSLRSVFRMFDDIFNWIDAWADVHRLQGILASTTFHPLNR